MKLSRVLLITAAAAVVLWGIPALAFHDDGVAHCNGCHSMHYSEDGGPPLDHDGNPIVGGPFDYLLKFERASDVCLDCHATSLGAVFGDDPLNPPTERGAGNFVFLLEDNINDGHGGAANPILGHAAGHSIISNSKGTMQDPLLVVSPGGFFPSQLLACSSCHDPHGTDAFRILYGPGRSIQGTALTFTNPAPIAEGLSLFGPGESNSNHTAYQSGMSEWCANCHGDFHNENFPTQLTHPSGMALGSTIATKYSLYNGTAQYATGDPATSYLAAVPYEDPAMTTSSTGAPSSGSIVMCTTCHRAHASSAPDSGRWDFNVTFLSADGDESGSYEIPDPYNDPGNQRSLCNKCHVQDAFDVGANP